MKDSKWLGIHKEKNMCLTEWREFIQALAARPQRKSRGCVKLQENALKEYCPDFQWPLFISSKAILK